MRGYKQKSSELKTILETDKQTIKLQSKFLKNKKLSEKYEEYASKKLLRKGDIKKRSKTEQIDVDLPHEHPKGHIPAFDTIKGPDHRKMQSECLHNFGKQED